MEKKSNVEKEKKLIIIITVIAFVHSSSVVVDTLIKLGKYQSNAEFG